MWRKMVDCILLNISQDTVTLKAAVFCEILQKIPQPFKNYNNNLPQGNTLAMYVGFKANPD